MDLILSLQRAVRNFPLGTAALAAHLGLSVHTLNHKVDPGCKSDQCSFLLAADICEATKDVAPLHAFAARLRHVALPMDPHMGDTATAQQMAETVQEFGAFLAVISQAVADGRISRNELVRIEKEGSEAVAAIMSLIGHAKAVHLAGIPKGIDA